MAEITTDPARISREGSFLPRLRRHPVAALAILFLLLLVLFIDVVVDEPVRRWLENGANQRVRGYSFELAGADLKPWTLALYLEGLRVYQDSHPGSPVGILKAGALKVEWPALLHGRVVADLTMQDPMIVIDTAQLETEDDDNVAFDDRGWQRLWELYPLEVNTWIVRNGVIRYVDVRRNRNIELSAVNLQVHNIRHVDAVASPYPSPMHLQAVLPGNGRLILAGHADFLRRPHAAINTVVDVADAPLAMLGPIVDDYRIKLSGGRLSAHGQVELRPEAYIANFADVRVGGLEITYDAAAKVPADSLTRARIRAAADAAKESPAVRLRLRSLTVTGTVAYQSATTPRYRARLEKTTLQVHNFSNREAQGTARFALKGSFMGSGATEIRGEWQPGAPKPEFAASIRVTGTKLQDLNPVLAAHGHVDAAGGSFSLYSQVYAHDGHLGGYVKPLIKDPNILSAEDRSDSFFHRLYEGIAEAIANILENRPRNEVATVVDLSGDLSDPKFSQWQMVGNLLRNGLFKAILPGFIDGTGASPAAEDKPDDRHAPK